jgi:hypothetical protein
VTVSPNGTVVKKFAAGSFPCQKNAAVWPISATPPTASSTSKAGTTSPAADTGLSVPSPACGGGQGGGVLSDGGIANPAARQIAISMEASSVMHSSSSHMG